MKGLVVVGAQWGDEGKGKITNYLASKADVVIRYQGGNNAGHTVCFNNKEFHLSTIPSGIFNESTLNILGNGMVINPLQLVEEMNSLKKEGYSLSNLIISDKATLDLEYHLILDGLKEESLKDKKIGTTKKGIGPSYTSKIERSSLRMVDLLDEDFEIKFKEKAKEANKLISLYSGKPMDIEVSLKKYLEVKKELTPHIKETVSLLSKLKKEDKKILFEGAQGSMLDIDFGTFPYVTSSNTIVGGAFTGSGIGLHYINEGLGIVKAYTTRVGEGPFVTELFNELGDYIREKAHEYGVVTHRARRVGYLDLVQLKYSCEVNGFKYIAITLLDILYGIKDLKVCIKYKLDDKEIDYVPTSLKELSKCKPIYKEFKPFSKDISHIRKYDDLCEEAREYISFIEEYLDVKVALISTGKDQLDTIIKEDIF